MVSAFTLDFNAEKLSRKIEELYILNHQRNIV
jgi:hypothetical protein